MKSTLLSTLLACALFSTSQAQAQQFVNLTPVPMQMHVDKGVYRLPAQFTIGGAQLPDSIKAEAQKFVTDFNKSATGATASYSKKAEGAALELVHNQTLYKTLGQEGYKLSVTANGIRLESATTSGFFYGLTSLKKMLPACIAAGVKDEKVVTYELPLVQITDKPRFPYRGFMLDVARHFFSVQEVKKMLDVMAIYKLNKFHFHLTEDQGWRWEVKKYPKLTKVGAVASNTYVTSMEHGAYWTNQQYGPYFYTREDLKEIVAYAAAKHIEVIPEIDMPGHFSAAMAAYPEFSCNPDGVHRVETWGGVFTDVLNVANPKAVRFVKDILDELMSIFPSKNVHIGGDECPTTAWENNAECQAMYKKLNLTSYRQLQTHFIAEITDYLKSKGRKISVWNETVTEKGADLQLMKKTGATVYCWVPARKGAEIANSLGLPSIYTVYGPYYINRAPRKDGWMKTLPGNGSDHLKATYDEQPTDFSHSIGVQGTFWTEHVATPDVMEFLALPRLIAVGEAGWSPQSKKNFNSFVQRMRADTTMLNYGGYSYDRAYLSENKTSTMSTPTVDAPAALPKNGQVYVVRNTVEGHAGAMLADAGQQQGLIHSNTGQNANNGWEVVNASAFDTKGGTMTVQLRNVTTQRFVGQPETQKVERFGFPVTMSKTPAKITLTYAPKTKDFTLASGGKFLFPVSASAPQLQGRVSSGSGVDGENAVRPQGTGWEFVPARAVTYRCVTTDGKELQTITEYLPTDATQVTVPQFKGYKVKGEVPQLQQGNEAQIFTIVYKKSKHLVFLDAINDDGTLLAQDTIAVPVGESVVIRAPKIDFCSLKDFPEEGIQLTPTDDVHRTIVYTTSALLGVKAVVTPLKELKDGQQVLIYDFSTKDPNRAGFRNVASISGRVLQGGLNNGEASPQFVWKVQKKGSRWQFFHPATALFMPELKQSQEVIVAKEGGQFSVSRNADGTWKVQGTNGQYWDGVEGGMTGWHTYGHPYQFYTFVAAPYFRVTVRYVDTAEKSILPTEQSIVPAGSEVTIVAPDIKDFKWKETSSTLRDLNRIDAHGEITVVYEKATGIGSVSAVNSSQPSSTYDLQGRRVEAARHGLFIVNGKKLLKP
jgi:beta-L-N-acetylhexosaminidase